MTHDVHTQLRLLFLLPFAPRLDAMHGGGRVMAQCLAALAVRHRLALLYFRSEDEAPIDDWFRDRCDLLEQVVRPGTGRSPWSRLSRGGRLLASLLRRRPMWGADWASMAFVRRVREIARAWQPDLVQIEYHIMGQYIQALDECPAPRVLVEYEPGTRSAPYLKGLPSIVKEPLHRVDRLAWQSFEPAVLSGVQAVVVFTECDETTLREYKLPTPIVRIPPGISIPEQPLNPRGCGASLLFVGSFIHPPNVDAALRLARTIFPVLREHYPELELYIVGDQPPPVLKKCSGPNLVVTGTVSDVTPFLDRAAVFVVPAQQGGGIRIKVMEALAAGKAVVASRLAAEGLDVTDGDQISLADSDAEFVERVSRLLDDEDERVSMAKRARAWAGEHMGWDQSIQAYERLYRALLAGTAI